MKLRWGTNRPGFAAALFVSFTKSNSDKKTRSLQQTSLLQSLQISCFDSPVRARTVHLSLRWHQHLEYYSLQQNDIPSWANGYSKFYHHLDTLRKLMTEAAPRSNRTQTLFFFWSMKGEVNWLRFCCPRGTSSCDSLHGGQSFGSCWSWCMLYWCT